jgi:LysR family transcriptional regulator of abg operon
MKTHQIKAWLRLVDTGSIRAAARSLNLTQAAVTKTIRELEEDLDAPLITRSTSGIVLTEFGLRLTERLRLAWAQMELARQDIQNLRGGEAARVGVAVTPTAMWLVLPNVIRQFRQQMPLAALSVEEGLMNHALSPLRQGTVDFVLGAAVEDSLPNDMTIQPLGGLSMVVTCRNGHPLENATHWEALLDSDWLIHSSQDRATASHDFLCSQGINIERQLIRSSSFASTWSLLTQTDALMLCPDLMLHVPIYGQQVRRVPVPVTMPKLTLGIIQLKDAPLSHVAQVLAHLFERELQQLARTVPMLLGKPG